MRVTDIDSPIVVKPIEAPRKIDLFYKAKHLNQICYLSSNIHQGNEIFSVHSRGKQCAFMSLSAVNRPLIVLYLFVWESRQGNEFIVFILDVYSNVLSARFKNKHGMLFIHVFNN